MIFFQRKYHCTQNIQKFEIVCIESTNNIFQSTNILKIDLLNRILTSKIMNLLIQYNSVHLFMEEYENRRNWYYEFDKLVFQFSVIQINWLKWKKFVSTASKIWEIYPDSLCIIFDVKCQISRVVKKNQTCGPIFIHNFSWLIFLFVLGRISHWDGWNGVESWSISEYGYYLKKG